MKVTLLSSCVCGSTPDHFQFLSTTLINDTVAVDAGCLGLFASPQEQTRVRHVLLTHSHIDHLASLPIFLENVFENRPDCVTVHGSTAVLDCCRRDVFNDRLWPDFVALSRTEGKFLELAPIEAGQTVHVEGLSITAVELDHTVPTNGYIVRDGRATVAFISDTGPTDEVWRRLNDEPDLKGVFVEITFPSTIQWLADVSKHLTPATLAGELGKLTRPARIIAVHLKARYRDEIVAELAQLQQLAVEIGQFREPYLF